MVLFYKDYILGEDPTDVERVMLKIRRLGAFKYNKVIQCAINAHEGRNVDGA
jgi:hypothetical protein